MFFYIISGRMPSLDHPVETKVVFDRVTQIEESKVRCKLYFFNVNPVTSLTLMGVVRLRMEWCTSIRIVLLTRQFVYVNIPHIYFSQSVCGALPFLGWLPWGGGNS